MTAYDQEDNTSHINIDESRSPPLVEPGITGHKWVQKGNSLECNTCQVPHGIYIAPHLLLAGFTKDGMPKLVHFASYQAERAKLMSEQKSA